MATGLPARLRVLRRDDPHLVDLIVGYLALKVGLLAVAAVSSQLIPWNTGLSNANGWQLPDGAPSWLAGFTTWDSGTYLHLAQHFYDDPMRNAFFPLYPFVIRAVSPLFLGNTVVAGLVVSNLMSLLVVVYLYRLVGLFFTRDQAFRSVLMLLAFPTAFFFSTIYSESLFLALVLMAFYYAYVDRPWLAASFAFLSPLARAQGLTLVVPLAVLAVLLYRGSTRFPYRDLRRVAPPVLGAAAGAAAYFGFCAVAMGSPLAGLDAQRLYATDNSLANLLRPWGWFRENFLDLPLQLNGFTDAAVDRVVFLVAVVLLIGVIRTQHPPLWVYAVLVVVVPGMSGHLMSYTRMVLLAFPLFVFLGTRTRWITVISVPLMLSLQVLLFVMHSTMSWVA